MRGQEVGPALCGIHAGRCRLPDAVADAARKRCTALTRAGERCRSWAQSGTLQKYGRPLCVAHTGLRHEMPGPEDRAAGRQCTAKTRAGQRCQLWSTPGTDPPLCWLHARPEDNPRLRHGFYRAVPAFSQAEQDIIDAWTAEGRLMEAAIFRARLRLRSLLEYHKDSDRPLAEDLNSFVLTFRAIKAVAKLVIAQHLLNAAEKPGQALVQEELRLAAALAELEDQDIVSRGD